MDDNEANILQYEAQLAQVRSAAASLPDGPEKQKLEALEADLKELISLSRSNVEESTNDSLNDEYNLFKAELEELESSQDKSSSNTDPQTSSSNEKRLNDIRQELENLKGTKCQAPYTYKWTNDVTYSNAFITHVPEPDGINHYDDVSVKVMFTNPTHKEMLPCPYYLDGSCKFSDDKCRFSHGELVMLNALREYREPDFSKVCKGCKVLAKQEDGLWYRANVLKVNDSQCTVKFESNSKEESIPFHNILPLDHNAIENKDSCDSDSSCEDNNDKEDPALEDNDEELVKRILSCPPGSALGEWEKYTKGFGSKIMAKMGYIHGSGLGKNGMGRVEPVPAVILPAGKSLDHCMMLKEKAGNDKDLFKAERKLKHLQRKHEEKLKKAYEAEKEKTDVFTFINTTLHTSRAETSNPTKVKNEYKNETTRNLNVTGLQIAEELRKVEREIKSLNQSLTRHSPHTHGYNVIKEKLASKEIQLSQLHASERKVMNEQNRRRDREKLTVF